MRVEAVAKTLVVLAILGAARLFLLWTHHADDDDDDRVVALRRPRQRYDSQRHRSPDRSGLRASSLVRSPAPISRPPPTRMSAPTARPTARPKTRRVLAVGGEEVAVAKWAGFPAAFSSRSYAVSVGPSLPESYEAAGAAKGWYASGRGISGDVVAWPSPADAAFSIPLSANDNASTFGRPLVDDAVRHGGWVVAFGHAKTACGAAGNATAHVRWGAETRDGQGHKPGWWSAPHLPPPESCHGGAQFLDPSPIEVHRRALAARAGRGELWVAPVRDVLTYARGAARVKAAHAFVARGDASSFVVRVDAPPAVRWAIRVSCASLRTHAPCRQMLRNLQARGGALDDGSGATLRADHGTLVAQGLVDGRIVVFGDPVDDAADILAAAPSKPCPAEPPGPVAEPNTQL